MKSAASCKKTTKLVRKGVLYCAPFLLFSVAVVLASVWVFQTFIANSTYFDAITNSSFLSSPEDLFDDPDKDPDGSKLPQGSTSEESPDPDAFPAIAYGSCWGKLNVEGWERKDVPLIFGDTKQLLKKGACMSMKSLFCGQGGRTIISAHVNSYFYEMEDMDIGQIITIDTVYGTYRYQVINMFIFEERDNAILFRANNDEDNILFMYTCYPRTNAYAYKDKRLAVVARMIEGKDWSVEKNEA